MPTKPKIFFDENKDAIVGGDGSIMDDWRQLIWSACLKVTPVRLAIMKILSEEAHPLSVATISDRLGRAHLPATAYRSLEALSAAGIVTRIHISEDHILYELAFGRKHHHHAVCTSCGEIEDVAVTSACGGNDLNEAARRGLTKFRHLQSHSLEFFGLCKKCETAA